METLRTELQEVRKEIRELGNIIRTHMTDHAGFVASLNEKSSTAERNIRELWAQLNQLRGKCDTVSHQLSIIEGSQMGAGKLITIILGAASAAAAVVALLK